MPDLRAAGPVKPDGTRDTVPMRCKGWDCDDCGPWMRGRLIGVVGREATRLDLRYFWTFTLPAGARAWSDEDKFAHVSKVWSAFRHAVKRRLGHLPPFLWVKERHADGTPHPHALTNVYLPHALVKALWSAAGGGSVVWVERVDAQRVTGYLAKYLAKASARVTRLDGRQGLKLLPLPKGTRRYHGAGGAKTKGVYPVRSSLEPWDVQRADGTVWRTIMDPASFLRFYFARAGRWTGPPA